jgi:predicted ArsR family transcriptional regulator
MTNEERIEIVNGVRAQEFTATANQLSALEAELGERVTEIAVLSRAEQTEKLWRMIAAKHGDASVQGLLNTLWKWCANDGFEFTSEKEGNRTRMKVTRCPIAEMARRIGQQKWGYQCYCRDDFAIVRGFNPAIAFTRTKTLMQGDDCCDHCYEE